MRLTWQRAEVLFTLILRLTAVARMLYLGGEVPEGKLGRVALDGTKTRANASTHKAMNYGRMTEKERRSGRVWRSC